MCTDILLTIARASLLGLLSVNIKSLDNVMQLTLFWMIILSSIYSWKVQTFSITKQFKQISDGLRKSELQQFIIFTVVGSLSEI